MYCGTLLSAWHLGIGSLEGARIRHKYLGTKTWVRQGRTGRGRGGMVGPPLVSEPLRWRHPSLCCSLYSADAAWQILRAIDDLDRLACLVSSLRRHSDQVVNDLRPLRTGTLSSPVSPPLARQTLHIRPVCIIPSRWTERQHCISAPCRKRIAAVPVRLRHVDVRPSSSTRSWTSHMQAHQIYLSTHGLLRMGNHHGAWSASRPA